MNKNLRHITFGFLALLLLFMLNMSLGSVLIPLPEIINAFFDSNANEIYQVIIFDYRLPKAIAAVLVGFALSVSGMMMQTYFRNPLAGPYVLGLSSGSSLAVALLIMGGSFFSIGVVNQWAISLASIVGSFVLFLLIILVAKRIKQSMGILLVGVMFSSFAGAIMSVLSFFSSAENLQKFTFWSMGSLANLTWLQIGIVTFFVLSGLSLAFMQIKTLNALLLGETYAISMGINLHKNKYVIILATALLTGVTTAFVGPIAFVGMMVPHLVKMLFKTSQHHLIFWHALWVGGSLMLLFDMIAQLPGSSYTLPINAVTSLVGAPFVVWIILKRSKNLY
jgi:iron complex transport system permease protein